MNYKQEIIGKIIRSFRDFEKSLEEKMLQSGKEWTEAVRGVFEDVTPDKYVLRQIGRGARLWDHCWHQKDKTGCLKTVPLVAECEWGGNNGLGKKFEKVRTDFEKLLMARALVRVMIYDSGQKEGSAQEFAEKLRKSVEKFDDSQPGDTYLLIAAEGYKADFKFFKIEVKEKENISFQRVSDTAKKYVVWQSVNN